MVKKVSILGAGAWGTAFANLLANNRLLVKLWSFEDSVAKNIIKKRENYKYLPGVKLSEKIEVTTDIEETTHFSDWIISAIPTQFIRKTFINVKIDGKNIINVSKGIEIGTNLRISEVFSELFNNYKYAILSGPTFAHDVARLLPSAATLASVDDDLLMVGQQFLSNEYFRVYTSHDVIGVELGGALKNIMAIAVGISNGLRLGKSAEAALISRSLNEIIRLGKRLGARLETFMGLSCMGDLILTSTSNLSRNRRLGIFIGKLISIDSAIKKVNGVTEGYYTVKAVYEMSRALHVDMPITEKVYRILYEGLDPIQALKELMNRELKHEWIN